MQKTTVESVVYFLVNIVHRMGIIVVNVSYVTLVIAQNTVSVKGRVQQRVSISLLLLGKQGNNYEPVLFNSYAHKF